MPPPEQRGPAAPDVAIREARAAAGPWPWGSAPLAGKARRKSASGAEWAEVGGCRLVGEVWPGDKAARSRGLRRGGGPAAAAVAGEWGEMGLGAPPTHLR